MATAWQRTFRSVAIVQAAPPAAETVIASLVVPEVDGTSPVEIHAWVKLTTAGSTTVVVPKIRRTSISGQLVSDGTAVVIIGAAGAVAVYTDYAVDNPGDSASLVYVFTIAQTNGSGNGAVASVLLTAQTP